MADPPAHVLLPIPALVRHHTQPPAPLTMQNVVIMGTGSFALEAMEAAGRNNAKHITLVSRPRKR